MIIVDNITFKYTNNFIFNNFSQNYLDNEITGIVGSNGSGKTTLLKCLAGINILDSGIIFDTSIKNFRKTISYMPSEIKYYPKIKAIEFLKFAISSNKNINEKDIDKWNNIMNLPLSEYAETYSTGMKKKLLLMAIILKKESVIILDEPFSGLDVESCILLINILKEIKRKSFSKIIIASHDLEYLKDCCDCIDILKRGVILKRILKRDFKDLNQNHLEYSFQQKIDIIKKDFNFCG